MSKIIDYKTTSNFKGAIEQGYIPYGNPFFGRLNEDRQAFVKYKYGFLRRFIKSIWDFVW